MASPNYFNKNNIRIIDIRLLYNSAKKDDFDILEVLFTDFMKINPFYEDAFDNLFLQNREQISRFCPKVRAKRAYNMAKKAFFNSDFFNLTRVRMSLSKYLAGVSTYESYHLNSESENFYLWQVKDGASIPDYKDIDGEFKRLIDLADGEVDVLADALIKNGIVSLMHAALLEKQTIASFKTTLTKIEKVAFEAILESMKGKKEGSIIISSLMSKCKASRSTFKSLLLKMQENNIAKVANRGAGGTYIYFIATDYNEGETDDE